MDLLVVGTGPAGLAITAAAVKEGLSVVNLSPGGVMLWRNTYGIWQDELSPLVIDASGHSPTLVVRSPHPPLAYQAAYGVLGTFTRPPLRPGQLLFMDYRSDFPAASGPPTFLYGMDLGDGRFFLEETSLAARPAMSFAQLKDRLEQRLAQLGTALREVHGTEQAPFPMNAPLPAPQRVIGFGGAASAPRLGLHDRFGADFRPIAGRLRALRA